MVIKNTVLATSGTRSCLASIRPLVSRESSLKATVPLGDKGLAAPILSPAPRWVRIFFGFGNTAIHHTHGSIDDDDGGAKEEEEEDKGEPGIAMRLKSLDLIDELEFAEVKLSY